MAGMSASDIDSIVTQSVTSYQKSLDSITKKMKTYDTAKTEWESIQSLSKKLKSAATDLKSSDTFYGLKASSSDTDIFTVSASSTAGLVSYALTDITMAQSAQKTGVAVTLGDGTKEAFTSTSAVGAIAKNAVISSTSLASSVTNGYFTVNDQKIYVDTSKDTLMQVIGKINASSAGVKAEWDDTNEKITITSKTAGDGTIDFSTDKSGFLSAMKINTTTATTTGTDDDIKRNIDEVSSLSGINNGFFTINGITFNVDKSADSLQDVISDINSSNAGVSAYFNKASGKMVLTAEETGKDITLSNDTSNFLTSTMGDLNTATFTKGSVTVNGWAMAIDSNTFTVGGVTFKLLQNSQDGATATVSRDTEGAVNAVKAFVDSFNAVLDGIGTVSGDGGSIGNDRVLSMIKSNLRTSVTADVQNTGCYSMLADIGVTYKNGRLYLDSGDLNDAIKDNPEDVAALFGYDNDGDGVRDDGGVANTMINGYLTDLCKEAGGSISNREDSIDDKIDKGSDDYKRVEKLMTKKETKLRAQYEAYAAMINKLNQQYSSYSSSLSSLTSMVTSMNSSSASA